MTTGHGVKFTVLLRARTHARWRTQTAWLSYNRTFFFKKVEVIGKYNFSNNSVLDNLQFQEQIKQRLNVIIKFVIAFELPLQQPCLSKFVHCIGMWRRHRSS